MTEKKIKECINSAMIHNTILRNILAEYKKTYDQAYYTLLSLSSWDKRKINKMLIRNLYRDISRIRKIEKELKKDDNDNLRED